MYTEGVFLPRSRGLPVLRLPPVAVPRDALAVERIGPSTRMGPPRPSCRHDTLLCIKFEIGLDFDLHCISSSDSPPILPMKLGSDTS